MKKDKNGNGKSYWLRSTTPNRPLAGAVRNGCPIADHSTINYPSNPTGVSPAMNIDYNSVMFATLVAGKKKQTGAEYKFTLIDNDMSITLTKKAMVHKDYVNTVCYSVSTTGQAVNTVSVLILDKEAYQPYSGDRVLADDVNILYYDRLSTGKSTFSETGAGNFLLPEGLDAKGWGKDYHVYLLAEQINDAETTDYCSPLCEISTDAKSEIVSYPLWVGGEQVTEANKDDLCGGKAVYYPYEHKLTFNNATIDAGYTDEEDGKTAAIYSNLGELNITGKADISGVDYGIRSVTDEKRKERVSISATLDITATQCAISAGDLRILDGKLTANVKGGSKPDGISTRYLTVNGGFVKIQTEGYGCRGISTMEFTANGGTVYAYATGDDARGILLATSVVVDGGYINVYAHDTSTTKTSVGIMLGDNTNSGRGILVYDGGVYSEGEWYAIGSPGDFTFYIDERMEISVPENGKLNASGTIVVNADDTVATKANITHKDYYIQFKSNPDLVYNYTAGHYEAIYNGKKICPEIEVYDRYGNLLKAGTNYTVKYANNTNVDKKGRPATVAVKFKGSLSGTKKLQFYVVPATLKSPDVTVCDVSVLPGKTVAPALYYNGRKLTSKDFSVTSKTGRLKFTASDDESNRKITITGKGNFKGAFEDVPVNLMTAADTKAKTIKVKMRKGLSFVYNGKTQPIRDNFEVTDAAGKTLSETYWDFKYIGSTRNVGTLKIVVWGRKGYTGNVVKTVTIKPDKDRAMMKATLASDTVMYTRSGATPTVTVMATFPDNSTQTLAEGKDYSLSCSRNKQVTSSAVYKITFKGSFKGRPAMTGTYSIRPAVLTAGEVSLFGTDKIYTKPGKYASFPYITYDGALLSQKDVTVTYKVGGTDITNNKKFKLEGEYADVDVVITGKGNYTTNTTPIATDGLYRIRKAPSGAVDLSKVKITMKGNFKKSIPVQAYTGSEVCPDFDIYVKVGRTWMTAHEAGLSPEIDYLVEYVNNKNKGTASVVVRANPESTKAMKSKTAKFKIGARNLTSMTWYKWLVAE